MSTKHEYDALPNEEFHDRTFDLQHKCSKKQSLLTARSSISFIICAAIWALIGSVVTFAATKSNTVITLPPRTEYGDCSGNATIARAKGCVFDPMMTAWMPRECFDEEHFNQSLKTQDWDYQWFEDFNMTKPIPFQTVLLGEYDYLFTDITYHALHCYYIWKKQARVLLGVGGRRGGHLDSKTAAFEHSLHCVDTIRWTYDNSTSRTVMTPALRLKCVVP